MSHKDGPDMNLNSLKREPSEVTENDTASLDEVNDFNVTRNESDATHKSIQLNGKGENVVDGVLDKLNIKVKESGKTAMCDQLGCKEDEVISVFRKLNIKDKESDKTDNGVQLDIKEEQVKGVSDAFGKLNIKDKEDVLKTHRPADTLNNKDKKVEITIANGLKATIPERKGKEEIKKRGPTGGIPVSNGSNPMENQYFPTGAPLPANYTNPEVYHHHQQHDYAALNGRRVLEDADQPPRKFIAAPNFHPRQMTQNNLNDLNQGQMPALTYQQGQIVGQSNIKLTTTNIAPAETVTVNLFGETEPPNENFVDELLDSLEEFQSKQNNGTNYMTPNMTQISGPVADLNQAEPLGHPISQPYMSVSSQIPGSIVVPVSSNTALGDAFSQQSTRPSMTRHKSDLSDSGIESAGQASPFPDSVPSPDESTPTAPSSVYSGFGTNPTSVALFPENNNRNSVSSTPPNIYSGKHLGIPGRCDNGSPVMPQVPTTQTSKNATTTPSDLQCQEAKNDQLSDYIDEHLDGLQDALALITGDTRHDIEGKPFDENVSASQGGQYRKSVCMENGNFQALTSPKNNNGKLPTVAEFTPATTQNSTVPPVTSNITTDILPTQQPFVVPTQQPVTIHYKPTISTLQTLPNFTTTKPKPTQKPFFAPPPQRVETKTLAVFIVSPNMAGQPETAPGFLVPRVKTQTKQTAKRRLREIRPKPVPVNAETQTDVNTDQKSGNMGTQIDTTTAQIAGDKIVSGPDQPTVKNTQTQSQPNLQGTKQRQGRPLDSARRNLKAVKTETLKRTDGDGNTYLHLAICNEDKFGIKALLERIKREKLMLLVDQENNVRQTPLFLAVAVNDPAKVQLLINAGANLNTLEQNPSSDGQTTEVRAAIHVAAVCGKEHLKTLEALLKGDVNINLVNNYGQTALHLAVLVHGENKTSSNTPIDSGPIIQALIKKGADPCVQDKKTGKTPLMYAIQRGHISLVEIILNAVEPSNKRNLVTTQAFDGSSCLKIAEGKKHDFNTCEFNRLWDILQRATSG